MNKQTALQLIRDTFNCSFDEDQYKKFILNLFNNVDQSKAFSRSGNLIPESFQGHINQYKRFGQYTDPNGDVLDLLVVKLQNETSLNRARSLQRNFIAWYLKTKGEKDTAVVVFYSENSDDWRFSFVKMEYRQDTEDSGKINIVQEIPPAKRYSFLVGKNEPNHTAQSQLVNILAEDNHNPTLSELEQAFNIETVTKEFFIKYRSLFMQTKDELDIVVRKDEKIRNDFNAKEVDTVNFAKKLLGQIVFLYFLQKKGWFGVGRDNVWGTGSKHFLRELFNKKHGNYKNFFNDILEPLFYEALRTGQEREHEDFYYSRFDCKIPFLNGGLFDPIGNYDWVHTDIEISNDLFSNYNKTKEGDTGNGILDIFDRYNFTVKEDEPLEKEVAIDPELLGKIYEKFNAIRSDNFEEYKKALKSGQKGDESKFNKQFGVYYTPREIVHYMCKQSLINYLTTELGGKVEKDDIETLIDFGDHVTENEAIALIKEQSIKKGVQNTTSIKSKLHQSIREYAPLIDEKLENITVCDPAVGSGAFPLGMMNEIVKARCVLSVFMQYYDRKIYIFKRNCIEHSLYGVDIDPGAVEIAKLRLWLSLVVDEDDIKTIKPLPNLDYKIMQGNSLIELLSAESLVGTLDHKRSELVKDLRKSKDELFNITIPAMKEKKRGEIEILIKTLFMYDRDKQIQRLNNIILAIKSQKRLFEDDKHRKEDEKKIREIENRIAEIKCIDVTGHSEHFEWNINYSEIFHEKGGFDLVIGNPPYFSLDTTDFPFKNNLKKMFPEIFSSQGNIYFFFIKKSIDILKKNGVLTFINENYYLSSKNARLLREYLVEKTSILFLIDFRNVQLFESVNTLTLINSFRKAPPQACEVLSRIVADSVKSLDSESILKFLSSFPNLIQQKKLNSKQWLLISDTNLSFKAKIDKDSFPLIQCVNMGQGMTSGNNNVFIVSKEKVSEYMIEDAVLRKYVKTRDIQPYVTHYRDLFLIYTQKDIGIDLYPKTKKYLLQFREQLLRRFEVKRNPNLWSAISVQRNKSFFEDYDDKILTPLYSKGNKFSYDDCKINNYFVLTDVYILVSKSNEYSLKYLLGLLNSKLFNYYVTSFGKLKRDGYYEYSKNTLSQLPIKKDYSYEKVLILVESILAILNDTLQSPQRHGRVKALKLEIDQLVYKLYDLTPEEIRIVEGEGDR